MADQDWDNVTRIGKSVRGPGSGGVDRERVIKGKSALNAAGRSGAIIGTEKKFAGANTVRLPLAHPPLSISVESNVHPPHRNQP